MTTNGISSCALWVAELGTSVFDAEVAHLPGGRISTDSLLQVPWGLQQVRQICIHGRLYISFSEMAYYSLPYCDNILGRNAKSPYGLPTCLARHGWLC